MTQVLNYERLKSYALTCRIIAAKTLVVLFIASIYLLFGAIAFSSVNAAQTLSYISLLMSIVNSLAMIVFAVHYCAKYVFATHEVKVLDLKSHFGNKAAPQSAPDPMSEPLRKRRVLQPGPAFVGDDPDIVGEDELDEQAKRITDSLFGPTKENLKDSLL